MRKGRSVLTILVGLMLLMYAGGSRIYANGNGDHEHGNNGTVKIHEGGTENEPVQANEPHVCTFHLHGLKFDAGSSGTWRIERWSPTGSGVAAAGMWGPADEAGDWRTAVMALPDGHYKLFWKQTIPETEGGSKQKVFWVQCGEASAGGTTGATTAATTGGQPGSLSGAGSQSNGGSRSGTGSESKGSNAANGARVTGTNSQSNEGGTTGATTPTTGATTGATTAATTGAGTTGGAAAGTTGGAEGSSGGVAGVGSLPSTSTGDHGALPALGGFLITLGGFLLRRPLRRLG